MRYTQADTQALGEHITDSYSQDNTQVEVIKEWSLADPVRMNIIAKLVNDEVLRYLKAYTKKWKKYGKSELQLIKLFNEYSKEAGLAFSAPEILDEKSDPFHFIMKDVEQDGTEMLDFPSMSREEIMAIYKKYRPIFDGFKEYSKGKTSKKEKFKMEIFQKLYSAVDLIERTDNRLLKLIRKSKMSEFVLTSLVKYFSKKTVSGWIDSWLEVVSQKQEWVNKDKLMTTYVQLQKDVKKCELEYNFGRFRTSHVFQKKSENGNIDEDTYKLLDFDNVTYQVKGTELTGIMRSNCLLAVENYQSYEQWRADAMWWYETLLEEVKPESIVRMQLFQKLIGTIFADYGSIRQRSEEKEKFEKNKAINCDEVSDKGIEWNYKLLQELYWV